jgi:hypothetical protein
MTKLASFLKRFGPEYSEWLNIHDEHVAMSERERIVFLLNKHKISLPERVLKMVNGDSSE